MALKQGDWFYQLIFCLLYISFSIPIESRKFMIASIEKTSDYNIPPCLAFVDYEKAFDLVERTVISNALYKQGVKETYIKFVENIICKLDFCIAIT